MPVFSKPRILVACLTSYNEGRLHAIWIDLTQDNEYIALDICIMLSRSPIMRAKDWEIIDYEGTPALSVAAIGKIAEIVTTLREGT